jgi:hypothetical protein
MNNSQLCFCTGVEILSIFFHIVSVHCSSLLLQLNVVQLLREDAGDGVAGVAGCPALGRPETAPGEVEEADEPAGTVVRIGATCRKK